MRARWVVFCVVLALILAPVLAYFLTTPPPPAHRVTVSLVARLSNQQIPTGNYPFNESAATEYTSYLIKDYRNKADLEGGRYPVLPDTAHFFPLYAPAVNSWEVLVAKEFSNATDNRIEFLFVQQIIGTDPRMVFYHNVTAPYLRPFETLPNMGVTAVAQRFGRPMGKDSSIGELKLSSAS